MLTTKIYQESNRIDVQKLYMQYANQFYQKTKGRITTNIANLIKKKAEEFYQKSLDAKLEVVSRQLNERIKKLLDTEDINLEGKVEFSPLSDIYGNPLIEKRIPENIGKINLTLDYNHPIELGKTYNELKLIKKSIKGKTKFVEGENEWNPRSLYAHIVGLKYFNGEWGLSKVEETTEETKVHIVMKGLTENHKQLDRESEHDPNLSAIRLQNQHLIRYEKIFKEFDAQKIKEFYENFIKEFQQRYSIENQHLQCGIKITTPIKIDDKKCIEAIHKEGAIFNP